MQQPSELKQSVAARPNTLPRWLKIGLGLVCLLLLGGFVRGWYQGRTSGATNAKTSINDTLKEGWVIGNHDRVRELVNEYEPINFIRLSDFAYFTPDLGEKPDPKKMALNVIPAAVKAMHGRKYALTGFMLPLDAGPQGMTEFILNGNQDMCYFGAPVQMNEWVHVTFVGRSGKVPFSHLPLTVFGTLEVGEVIKDGAVESIFRMQAQAVSTPRGVIE